MDALLKNDLVEYSTNYAHTIPPNKTHTLEEFADIIEKHYNASNKNRTGLVCMWLRGTEGTIIKNRFGATWLRYKKHVNFS